MIISLVKLEFQETKKKRNMTINENSWKLDKTGLILDPSFEKIVKNFEKMSSPGKSVFFFVIFVKK